MDIKNWWNKNRAKYNKALIISGFLGFICYCLVGGALIPAPYFEVTIFTTFFQGILFLIMMGVANILYTLVMLIDCFLNKSNKKSLSHKILYYGYFIGSCLLPFSISVILFLSYYDGYPQELMYYDSLP